MSELGLGFVDDVESVTQISEGVSAQGELSKHDQVDFSLGLFELGEYLLIVVLEVPDDGVDLTEANTDFSHNH